jgi:hypothetical protein
MPNANTQPKKKKHPNIFLQFMAYSQYCQNIPSSEKGKGAGRGSRNWMSFFLAEKKLFLADKLFLT